MRIAILSRAQNSSPKILAQGLEAMLRKAGVEAKLFIGETDLLGRLKPLREVLFGKSARNAKGRLGEAWRKIATRKADQEKLAELSTFSAIVLSECIPNAFLRGHYYIEEFRKHLARVPIILYEVYYLGNAPRMQQTLQAGGHYGLERFDWHLAVSEVTEVRGKPAPPWSCVGLDLHHTGLAPSAKQGFVVLLDFAAPGWERFREDQISTVKRLGLKFLQLEGYYTIAEIRELYRKASVFLMQSSEAFGVSIVECLATGTRVFTPDSSWPMAFRLGNSLHPGGPGPLPSCFNVYKGSADLSRQLLDVKRTYDLQKTPRETFATFVKHYPHFFEGNLDELNNLVQRIEEGRVSGAVSPNG